MATQHTCVYHCQTALKHISFTLRWNTKDILNKMERDEDHVTSLLLNLKPWTQYAVYVQTYTTSSAKFGAISNIVYFTTLPYCTSLGSSQIKMIIVVLVTGILLP